MTEEEIETFILTKRARERHGKGLSDDPTLFSLDDKPMTISEGEQVKLAMIQEKRQAEKAASAEHTARMGIIRHRYEAGVNALNALFKLKGDRNRGRYWS